MQQLIYDRNSCRQCWFNGERNGLSTFVVSTRRPISIHSFVYTLNFLHVPWCLTVCHDWRKAIIKLCNHSDYIYDPQVMYFWMFAWLLKESIWYQTSKIKKKKKTGCSEANYISKGFSHLFAVSDVIVWLSCTHKMPLQNIIDGCFC